MAETHGNSSQCTVYMLRMMKQANCLCAQLSIDVESLQGWLLCPTPPPQAVILMLEDGQDYCAAKMCGLLEYMATSAVLTRDQITQVCISVGSCLESTCVSFSQHLWYQCHAIKFYAIFRVNTFDFH